MLIKCGPTIETGQNSKADSRVVAWHYKSGDNTFIIYVYSISPGFFAQ